MEFSSREHITLVLDRLDSLYGHDASPPGMYATGEPLDGLMLTLLSQNTNDRNRDRAYDALRRVCPEWKDAAEATAEKIAAAIKPGGLADIKSVRMKAILGRIYADFGEYSLAAMKSWPGGRARKYLRSLDGIGPKTVACVMIFDLGIPAFPVDTHVARISRRLGWRPEKTSPEKIQDFLESAVPPERCAGGHLNMIEHGRKACHARNPRCAACAVSDICRFGLEGEGT
ncbi:MAG: endonuclease III [Synergistaceae bacterium]|jgi:endonuclease-3|nr:endonuclease III [Synergistaceae bacterium]